MKRLQYFIASLLLLMVACKNTEKPVTKEQALVFADGVSKSIDKKDGSFFDEAFDMDLFATNIKARAPEKGDAYWQGLRQSLSTGMDFSQKIISALGKNGSYQLVKQYEKERKQHLIFRLYADDGFNYHDYELSQKKGKVKIVDIYIYTTGEYFSETMKNVFAEMHDAKDEAEMYKMSQTGKIRGLLQNGEHEKAKKIIDGLPINMRSLKAMQMYNIQICRKIGDSLYQDAIDKFQRDFPSDPSLDIILIDGYFMSKKYDGALACINRLDNRIATDPMLDYQRALIYNLMGKKEAALQSLEKLYKNMPKFSPGIMELSTYYMDRNEYEKAVDIMNKAKQNRDYDAAIVQNLYLLYPKLKPLMEQ